MRKTTLFSGLCAIQLKLYINVLYSLFLSLFDKESFTCHKQVFNVLIIKCWIQLILGLKSQTLADFIIGQRNQHVIWFDTFLGCNALGMPILIRVKSNCFYRIA